MYRGRYWGFANDFFAQFSKDCRLAQKFVLLIVEKHNGMSLNFPCGTRVKIYIGITLSSADLC